MIRHNKSVHKENGTISIVDISNRSHQLQASSNPAHITFFDSSRTNPGVLSQKTGIANISVQEGTDPIESVLGELESLASDRERIDKLMRRSPSHAAFPQTMPEGWKLSSPTTKWIPLSSMEPPRFVTLGYRGYICDKCHGYGITDFGIRIQQSKPTSIYLGIWNHLCSGQARVVDHEGQVNSARDQLINQLYDAFVKSSDDLYLFATEIMFDDFQAGEELNPVNFGQITPGDRLYSIIKNGQVSMKVGKEFISEFFHKTLSTYCLARIEDGEKKRLFLLIISPKLNAS